MKSRLKKVILPVLTLILAVSIAGNIYQNSKITKYEEDLAITLSTELQSFAGKIGNGLSDESLYAEEYGHIVLAQSSLVALNQGKGYLSDEYTYSLARLLQEIKILMLNDKTKVDKAFKDTDGAKFIFNIDSNFHDKESIEKVFKLLGE